jgi:hypothetical protein
MREKITETPVNISSIHAIFIALLQVLKESTGKP